MAITRITSCGLFSGFVAWLLYSQLHSHIRWLADCLPSYSQPALSHPLEHWYPRSYHGEPALLVQVFVAIVCGLVVVRARVRQRARLAYATATSLFFCALLVIYDPSRIPEYWFSGQYRRSCVLHYVMFSIVPPIAVMALCAYSVLYAHLTKRVAGHCAGCGYDLHLNVSGRCPECGRPYPNEFPQPDKLT